MWVVGEDLARAPALAVDDQQRPVDLGAAAVASAVRLFADGGCAKVHWPLLVIDGQGRRTGKVLPDDPLPEGDLLAAAVKDGPAGYVWPPTTGNAWGRRFLEAALPMPEAEFRTCPDYYLAGLAPLYGRIGRVPEPQSLYRIHGDNQSLIVPSGEKLDTLGARLDCCLEAVRAHGHALGLTVDPEACQARWWLRWLRRIYRATRDMDAALPPGATCILADAGEWENHDVPMPRRCLPFTERDGQYWGPPADDAAALRELERLRRAGAEFLVVGEPAFWWLDYYQDFHRHLRERHRCVLTTDRVVIFDLRAEPEAALP